MASYSCYSRGLLVQRYFLKIGLHNCAQQVPICLISVGSIIYYKDNNSILVCKTGQLSNLLAQLMSHSCGLLGTLNENN